LPLSPPQASVESSIAITAAAHENFITRRPLIE
jgi:hypothetical protein